MFYCYEHTFLLKINKVTIYLSVYLWSRHKNNNIFGLMDAPSESAVNLCEIARNKKPPKLKWHQVRWSSVRRGKIQGRLSSIFHAVINLIAGGEAGLTITPPRKNCRATTGACLPPAGDQDGDWRTSCRNRAGPSAVPRVSAPALLLRFMSRLRLTKRRYSPASRLQAQGGGVFYTIFPN